MKFTQYKIISGISGLKERVMKDYNYLIVKNTETIELKNILPAAMLFADIRLFFPFNLQMISMTGNR